MATLEIRDLHVSVQTETGLPPERLQSAIGTILQELYRRYAEWLLVAAVLQWLGSVVIRLS